ncbi:MAG: hypothetical protein VX836_02335 [Pseudomonadota bacterium]|nr:hypothetical protein [Pseudomonadota bacterium]
MWIVEMLFYAVVAAVLVFVAYREFFSTSHRKQREVRKLNEKRRFERRNKERDDRRQRNDGPPDGQERRRGTRR